MKTRFGFLFLLVAALLLQSPLWAQAATTLLTTTDLDCSWKLDGIPQGSLKADDATVVPLSLGKHIVQATSADGLDSWKTVVTITQAGQEMVEIKLKEARQRRVSESQPTAPPPAETAPPPAQPMTQPSAAQPPAQPVTPSAETQPTAIQPTAIERKSQPPTEDPTWTDPATRLMWAARDNGKNVTWPEARSYCSSLNLAGYSNWRLPTVDELAGVYDETQDVDGWHIKGGIRVSGWEWSSEARGSSEHQLFTFHNVKKEPIRVAFSRRALCVRPSTE